MYLSKILYPPPFLGEGQQHPIWPFLRLQFPQLFVIPLLVEFKEWDLGFTFYKRVWNELFFGTGRYSKKGEGLYKKRPLKVVAWLNAVSLFREWGGPAVNVAGVPCMLCVVDGA